MSRPDFIDKEEQTVDWEQEYKQLKTESDKSYLYLEAKLRENSEYMLAKYREQHIAQLIQKDADITRKNQEILKLQEEINRLEDVQYGLREGLKAVLNT